MRDFRVRVRASRTAVRDWSDSEQSKRDDMSNNKRGLVYVTASGRLGKVKPVGTLRGESLPF